MPTTFSVPHAWIPFSILKATLPSSTSEPHEIHLGKVTTTQLTDYLRWHQTGRIIQYPHDSVEYALDHHARILISALGCGILLENRAYQCAAMQESITLAPLLAWPEDYVNEIFAATPSPAVESHKSDAAHHHPARMMIVAIVAATTCGEGKRKARHGLRDKGIEREDRIEEGMFWTMYDACCSKNGPECEWPERVEELIG